ncbi:Phosphatidylinositol-3,4,5-trisphosphate 3-phosphatase, putative [Hondaea fermentalgiana]|uniref:Phosphatidylinositol-3,4,5-trisphosphate 3-phosphatase, putative n=1 Tax=Hondaea fermentalgiana TaxID=2315210 RepID=A0A2R5GBT7_9STRA|nr:Phosphatidylinositol-3,4,5-trisphosphate 3-phosphatase, putative [Hondaea fermentalgiana]|eukprot:GBG25204.1 Phosphatidylinositol-3,4,5-trisphosphate 3-phosphatase, putative [Hondaea fermentalgiana]
MSWSFSNLKASSARLKMPTLDEFKNTVNSGMQAVNSGVQAVNSSVQEAVKDVNVAAPSSTFASLRGSASSSAQEQPKDEEQPGQQAKANMSSSLSAGADVASSMASGFLGKVRGVFDLDSLQAAAEEAIAADEMHFAEYDLTYITERVVVMGYPAGPQRGGTANSVANFLNKRHGNDYMIWNISERTYDYSFYNGQVVDTKFPGYPAPPIGMLFNLCMAMESWLKSEASNVVVIHCMTGRGRSAAVCACLLEWVGRAASAREALAFVLKRRRAEMALAIVPTQLRYIDMFHEIMEGIRPRSEPLNLKRLIASVVPNMMSSADRKLADMPSQGGCKPYLQVFKNGKLLFTTAWADEQAEGGTRVYPASKTEGFDMDVDCFVDGDILLRLRHIDTSTGKPVSIFRYGFHTGYVPTGTLRLSKADLDGASVDERIPANFHVELEFEPAQDKAAAEESADAMFDATLSSKAAFWDEIARKKQQARQRSDSEQDRLLNASKALDLGTNQGANNAGAPPEGAQTASGAAGSGSDVKKPDQVVEFSLLDDEDDFDEPARDDRRGSADSTSALFSSLIGDSSPKPPSSAPLAAPALAPTKEPSASPELTGATSTTESQDPESDVKTDAEVKHDSTELRKASSSSDMDVDATAANGEKGNDGDDDDDDDLDALERDLGIEEGNDEDEDGGDNLKAASSKGGAEEDPDLAELEQYLEGL